MDTIFLNNSRRLLGLPISKNSADKPVDVYTDKDIERAVKVVDLNPSMFQKITENYRKAHLRLNGLLITIENPKGSIRSKQRPDGSTIWASNPLQAHYGYIKRTIGADWDQVDVFIGDHHKSDFVFLIDQRHLHTGRYDETKCMVWFKSMKQAVKCYDHHFSDGSGPERRMGVTGMDFECFKKWLKTNETIHQMVQKMVQKAKNKKDKKGKKDKEGDGGMATCVERTPTPCAGYPRKKR